MTETPLPLDAESAARADFITVLSNYFDKCEALYDFGCGDGFMLKEVTRRIMGRAMGADSHIEIPNKKYEWICHPVDLATKLHLGPPGNVMCIGAAEHISSERLPSLVENLQRHTKKKLVLVWSLKGYQGIAQGINPKTPDEVIRMVQTPDLRYHWSLSEQWQEMVGDALWWNRKQIYVFQRVVEK